MKAFYYEFFHIPKQGKLRERVLMSHVVLTAVLTIVSLLAISGSAYAFHTWATRIENTFMAAHFEAEIMVNDEYGEKIELQKKADGTLLAMLEEPGLYEVTVLPGGTAETGFCTMQLEGEDYITAQLGISVEEDDEYREFVKFYIQAYEPVPVSLNSQWGTSTAYVNYMLGDLEAENYLVGDEYIEAGDPANTWLYIEQPEEEETEYIEEFEYIEEIDSF